MNSDTTHVPTLRPAYDVGDVAEAEQTDLRSGGPTSAPRLQWLQWLLTKAVRIAVFVVGAAVVGAGVAMLVLPGPGVLIIVFGLVILTTQFVWAERALDRMTGTAASMATIASSDRRGRILLGLSGTAMVVGGGMVAVVFGEHRWIGASVLLSGLIGLASLVPAVSRWIAARANPAAR